MNESRRLLQHFLAALAYRTQKALRCAPDGFADFRAASSGPDPLATFDQEIARFHETLQKLRDDFADPALTARITDDQFLQEPLADAMTHAGQLAMLRRMGGSPVASENFIFARIDAGNVTSMQAEPVAPDPAWHPDDPPLARPERKVEPKSRR